MTKAQCCLRRLSQKLPWRDGVRDLQGTRLGYDARPSSFPCLLPKLVLRNRAGNERQIPSLGGFFLTHGRPILVISYTTRV